MIMEPLKPKFRFKLKSRIIAVGYKNTKEFSDAIGIGLPKLSRIICGWELPSTTIQSKMAQFLGISIKELGKLL